MLSTRFPQVDVIREALKEHGEITGLEFFKKTDIPPGWYYGFLSRGKGRASDKYAYIIQVVSFLEKERGVVFTKDGFSKAA